MPMYQSVRISAKLNFAGPLVRGEFEIGKFPSDVSKLGGLLSKRIKAKFRVWAGSDSVWR